MLEYSGNGTCLRLEHSCVSHNPKTTTQSAQEFLNLQLVSRCAFIGRDILVGLTTIFLA